VTNSDINIKWIETKLLKPNPKNNNKHSKEQIDRLAKILAYQGFRTPIVVDKDMTIWSGHGRLEAAKQLGLKKVPVSVQEFTDETQAYTYLVSDNAIALWAELDLSAINAQTLDLGPFDTDLLGLENWSTIAEDKYEGKDLDALPNMNTNERGVKLGDLYECGPHRVMCGSSLDLDQVKHLMDGQLADLWIADPPFGVSYVEKNAAVCGGIVKNAVGKEIKSDTLSVEELKPFWKSCAEAAYAVTTDKASNYWCACQGSDKMMMMMMMMMDEAGWNIRHELIWVKQQFVFGRSDYHYRHEPIIYGWKKKGTHEWFADRKQDSVFEIDRPHKSDLHPTTKPVELFSRFIQNSTAPGQRVFESFGGSGTTLIASEKLGRASNTMELDPHYVGIIIQRWEDLTGLKSKKL
jgi:site-specific DNA-methyltransferase (adenine-specific)